jgi:hypothetical protein
LKGRDHLEDLVIDVRLILKWIFKEWDVVAWSGMTQDRDKWRTFLNAVMNLRVSWNAGNFLNS